jgi:hypothetical protein
MLKLEINRCNYCFITSDLIQHEPSSLTELSLSELRKHQLVNFEFHPKWTG